MFLSLKIASSVTTVTSNVWLTSRHLLICLDLEIPFRRFIHFDPGKSDGGPATLPVAKIELCGHLEAAKPPVNDPLKLIKQIC